MPAFEQAIRDGADGVELDIRASKDGEVMVFHDATLERLAARSERVRDLTYKDLRGVELRDGGRTPLLGHIPTLHDVIDVLRGTDLLLNIEIKGDGGRRFWLTNLLSALLRRRSAEERSRMLVSSFRPEVLVWLQGLGQKLPVGFLFDGENTGSARARFLEHAGGFDVVHPQFRLVESHRMSRWKAANKLVNVWTVDAEDELLRLADLGVDGVITNDPGRARQVLDRAGHCRAGNRGL